MSSKILSGKDIAESIKSEVSADIARLKAEHGITPCLAVVRVGDDPASAVYVGNKVKTSEAIGLISEEHHLPANVSRAELIGLVRALNWRDEVDGILVQLPLPDQINDREILELIDPDKDVDGFHPVNVGRLSQGEKALAMHTGGCHRDTEAIGNRDRRTECRHRRAEQHRRQADGNASAEGECDSDDLSFENARDLPAITKQADILIAAIGRAGFIRGEHIREGATVIDVGINNVSDVEFARELFDEDEIEKRLAAIEKRGFTLVGDVNPKEAKEKAGNFTPVPGGVGLLTVAMLMKNTVEAAKTRRGVV